MNKEILSQNEFLHTVLRCFKVAVDTLTMNIFVRQNIGRSIIFKILIQSRFRHLENLEEILENDQSASGLFYIQWMAFLGQYRKQLKLNLLKCPGLLLDEDKEKLDFSAE